MGRGENEGGVDTTVWHCVGKVPDILGAATQVDP